MNSKKQAYWNLALAGIALALATWLVATTDQSSAILWTGWFCVGLAVAGFVAAEWVRQSEVENLNLALSELEEVDV